MSELKIRAAGGSDAATSGSDNGKYKIRDFLAAHFGTYCKNHSVPLQKLKVMRTLISCKTGDLGYTLMYCENCGGYRMRACACGNRNCPGCGYLRERKWAEIQKADIIPDIPYFHMVFTLPHELNELMYQNQKETLNLLFRSVKDAILTLSMNKLEIIPGFIMVLHTFASNLSLHYHLHVLVSGGGITKERTGFRSLSSEKFFLPVGAISSVCRGKFLSGLKELRKGNLLKYFGDALRYRNSYTWKELPDTCCGKDRNVEIKYLAPLSRGPGSDPTADNTVSYFARYTGRTAISNSRVLSFGEEGITFRYKDYQGSSYTVKPMTLSPDEFIRRFLTHILPPGFMRIRYGGFLAGCIKKKTLALVHCVLGKTYHPSHVRKMTSAQLIEHFFGKDIYACPVCSHRMKICPGASPTLPGVFSAEAG